MINFKDLNIVITGASSGIGEALAIELAKREARLVILARRMDELERVKANCLRYTSFCECIALDLGSEEQINQAGKSVLDVMPVIDLLINNAGISQRGFARVTTYETEKRIMQVNFLGPVLFTKLLLPHFNTDNAGVIVTSSVVGLFGFPTRSTYSASKHALHGYFNTLAIEEFGKINVTIVCPGRINTPISYSAVEASGEAHGKMDPGQANGIPADICARKMLKAYSAKKQLVLIARGERLLYWFSKFAPPLYRLISRKISPV
jgi:dehydrogenase/reductase SDR family member 7B